MNEPIIITNPALCHDCYRCVRNCDVKAIRVMNGQAQVVQELCILCGTCVRVCPQKAKGVRSARQEVIQALREGRRVVASVAPSIPAFFPLQSFAQVEESLKSLGFHAAEETAVGAHIVAQAHREYMETSRDSWPIITSSCPVIVNLVEKYYPDLIGHLAPIVSPLIAHGRILARKYGPEAYIVFIGPCIAKKMEIHDEAVAGVVHAAMTFQGLQDWMKEANIDWPEAEERQEAPVAETARLFPIEGGLIGTARMTTDILDKRMVIASGLRACRDILNDIRSGQLHASMAELLACKGGCVNGPAMAGMEGGIYTAREKVIRFYGRCQPDLPVPRDNWPDLGRGYRDRMERVPEFSEEDIRNVLHRINKYTPDDELNCGACGYSTCREKALATLRGMAEVTMCIPYMRRRSESLRQVVMDATPNAIIIVDDDLLVQDMSPSAESLFQKALSDVKGRHLSNLIMAMDDFIHVRDTGVPIIGKARRLKENLIGEQSIVRVEGQLLMVAIIRDVTERENEREQFRSIREETLERTREVLGKQMRVAHEIAHLLGETTAESKTIVTHLARLLEGDDQE